MSDASTFPLDPPFHPVSVGVERRDRGGLRRIRDARFAELAYRGWQEASKWLDRVAPMELPDRPDILLARHARELADPDAVMSVIRGLAPERCFPGIEDAATSACLEARLREHCADVCA